MELVNVAFSIAAYHRPCSFLKLYEGQLRGVIIDVLHVCGITFCNFFRLRRRRLD